MKGGAEEGLGQALRGGASAIKRKVNILLHTFMTHFGAALAKNFWDAKLPSGTIKAVKKFSKL